MDNRQNHLFFAKCDDLTCLCNKISYCEYISLLNHEFTLANLQH